MQGELESLAGLLAILGVIWLVYWRPRWTPNLEDHGAAGFAPPRLTPAPCTRRRIGHAGAGGRPMTEAEWLASDRPGPMLRHLRATGAPRRAGGRRKLRLFGCACVRRKWKRVTDPRSRTLIVAAERYADGLAGAEELEAAELAALEAREEEAKGLVVVGAGVQLPPWCLHTFAGLSDDEHPQPAWGFALAATLIPRVVQATAAHGPEDRAQAALVRDIFGNPFRPATFSPAWRTSTALALARQMYDSCDFTAMPMLADALQDAWCDNPDILDHCRGDGPHVRGCWVVDLVLGIT